MKFISWNVNGLRACAGKGFADTFTNLDADFFCLQETKLQAGQLDIAFPGYESYWNYAEKKGYSGTAIFTKHTPVSVHYGMQWLLGDEAAEHEHEGRVITLEYDATPSPRPEAGGDMESSSDTSYISNPRLGAGAEGGVSFYLITLYVPNSQDGLRRLDYRMQWEDAFLMYLKALDAKKPVIFCGDLNVAHEEIDLKNPKTNHQNAGFSDEERAKFTALLAAGFKDTFRTLHPDDPTYSWWSYRFHAREKNVGWRIDYFVVSERLMPQVESASIHTAITGSDHCPVELILR